MSWLLLFDFNFASEDGRVTVATCKYYCPLVASPSHKALCNFVPLQIVAKSSILNVKEFLDQFLKTSPCTKTSPISCESQSFFLLLRNVATFIESYCVYLLGCLFDVQLREQNKHFHILDRYFLELTGGKIYRENDAN